MPNSILSAVAAGTMALSGGGSGLLSIPHAGLMPTNSVEYQHTNGMISVGEQTSFGRIAVNSGEASTDHFHFSVVPRLEFGGRLTTIYNDNTGQRDLNDLSGHLKFQLLNTDRLRLAVGIRDLAGEVQILSTSKFIVGDFKYRGLTVTFGWGESDEDKTALSGAFGGLSYRPLDWLNLLADYDGVATRYGLQLHTSYRDLGFYLKLAHSSDDYQDYHYAAGIQALIGGHSGAARKPDTGSDWLASLSNSAPQQDTAINPWAADEIRAGSGAEPNWYAYNVPTLALNDDPRNAHWLSGLGTGKPPLNGHLETRIHPVFAYTLGTEYGRLDYSLAMRASAQWLLPMGFSVFGAWDGNVLNSDDYREGGYFRKNRVRSGAVEYAAQYTAHVLPGQFVQLTGGKTAFFGELYGFSRVELASHLFDGRLALDYSFSKFNHSRSDIGTHQRLAKVFAWIQPGRYALEVTRGDFLFGDTGYRAEAYAYADRTRIGVYYKRGFNAFDFEAVGMTINFALSPRRTIGNRWASLKASPQFLVPMETQINDKVGNFLRPGFLREFVPQRQLVRDVLDRWRMSPAYLNQ